MGGVARTYGARCRYCQRLNVFMQATMEECVTVTAVKELTEYKAL